MRRVIRLILLFAFLASLVSCVVAPYPDTYYSPYPYGRYYNYYGHPYGYYYYGHPYGHYYYPYRYR